MIDFEIPADTAALRDEIRMPASVIWRSSRSRMRTAGARSAKHFSYTAPESLAAWTTHRVFDRMNVGVLERRRRVKAQAIATRCISHQSL